MMSEAKHTPGPWSVKKMQSGVYMIGGDSSIIVRLEWDADDDDEARANAKLIAAAPDMLEALKNAYHLLLGKRVAPLLMNGQLDEGAMLRETDGFNASPIGKMLKSAIDKAEGK